MGYWEIVVPEGTTNLIANPSFETATTGWTWAANAQGVGWGRVSDESKYGAYSAVAVCSGAGNRNVRTSTAFTRGANDDVTISVWVRASDATSPAQLVLRLWEAALGGADYAASDTYTVTTTWQRLTLSVADATMDAWNAGGVSLTLWVLNDADNGSNKTWYLDGAQGEALDHGTTYCDGTQPGCEWNGAEHASTSTRSALSRAGGRVYDLDDDYGFEITNYIDSGVAPLTQQLDEYAIRPGGEVSSYKVHPRVLTLTGHMHSTTGFSDLHDQIQALIGAVKPDLVPGNQPALLRYNAATMTKEISVYYEAGLEGNYQGQWCAQQNFAIRFLAADPFWYEVGESALILDTNDSATVRVIGARLRSTGQWDEVGPPDALGTYNSVYALAEDETYVYIGGSFQNWDNIANADYIVRYEKATGTYTAMGTGANNDVYVITIAPNGYVYAGGTFTFMGGVASTSRIAYWDGAAWNAIGVGLNGAVEDIKFDLEGNIWIGGSFTDVVGGPGGTYSYVCYWDGAAYNAIGVGADVDVRALAVSKASGYIYIGGDFANIAGVAAAYIAYWDGSAANAMGTGMNGVVRDIVIDESDLLYAGGAFTTAGGTTVNRIASWNGTAWAALSSGVNGTIYGLGISIDGILYMGGAFTTAGGITLTDRLAKWNGSTFSHVDANWPGAVTSYSIMPSHISIDPVIPANYDLWFGFDTTGTAYWSGSVTHSPPDNSTEHYPVIVVSRSGGTSATLVQIRNETLGQTLIFNYALLDGETLTVDLAPTEKTVISSYFGSRSDAILTGSDLATFHLRAGTNQITAFVDVAGAPTVTAYMAYRQRYWSLD